MNALFHVAIADCRERLRRSGIIVVAALAAFLGYQVIAGVFVMRLGSYRGVNNAAWIGTLMATAASLFLSLAGFYVVRGNVRQDRDSGVGQLLAATSLRPTAYIVGKFVSNVIVLSVVVLTLVVAATVMLAIRADGAGFELGELLLPFVAFAVPVALGVSAISLVFDVAPRLRDSIGNIAFFVLWLAVLPALGGTVLGFDEIERAMGEAILAQGGEYRGGVAFGIPGTVEMQTFVWTGFEWPRVLATRLLTTAAVLVAPLLGAVLLQRREGFDPTRSHGRRKHEPDPKVVEASDALPPDGVSSSRLHAKLTAPAVAARNVFGGFLAIVAGELRISLKGRPVLWYVVAAGLIVASFVAPLDAVRGVVLPILSVWPVLILSELGVRESKHGLESVLGSCPSPVLRQVGGAWAAGLAITMILGAGVFLRLMRYPEYLPAFIAGAVFVPSLALFLGFAFRTERVFQIVLIVLWYVGPVNRVAAFDFAGATDVAALSVMPGLYAVLGIAMVAAALVIRSRRSG